MCQRVNFARATQFNMAETEAFLSSLPAPVRARLEHPHQVLRPEEALQVIELCTALGAESAAGAANRRAVLIVGNTGQLPVTTGPTQILQINSRNNNNAPYLHCRCGQKHNHQLPRRL